MGGRMGHLGKALGSWIPLLAKLPELLIVVSPLTLPDDQHSDGLCKAGIRAINHDVDMDTIGGGGTPRFFEM